MNRYHWLEPLEIIKKIPATEKCWALLYSGMRTDFTGRYSWLAVRPKEEIISENFDSLDSRISGDNSKWFGYFGYGLKNCLEKLPKDKPGILNLPNLWMVNYRTIIIFDHEERKIEIRSDDEFDLNSWFNSPQPTICHSRAGGNPYSRGGETPAVPDRPVVMDSRLRGNDMQKISHLNSNMTKAEYLEKAAAIKEHILAGDIYQANLTRKFYGEFTALPSPVKIFEKLCAASPAPYSCIMKLDDKYIISSSPEMFLKISADGSMESRPIKGSSPREEEKDALAKSQKDKAENLMIVDLVRNDLARGCLPGSVKVESLFDVTSYSTLHHMSSTITGKKRPEISVLQTIKNCFPPGSMVGTPKIKAMEICSHMEGMARGVYSGAIGWISNDEAELSVVIRTLILNGKTFEFQVGGAIIHDSVPEKEWRETMLKAEGIRKVLGIGEIER